MEIICGDALEKLRELPSRHVQCCITSPPYWRLRDYGVSGQLGLEKTPEEYIEKLVEIFRDIRRVLRDDGTLWLNLGDSYSTGHSGQSNLAKWSHEFAKGGGHKDIDAKYARKIPHGYKSKDLLLMPYRIVLALQSDGWFVRCDIIWSKKNCMPESVKDRPTKTHEYIFLLSKSLRYYYDAEAIKEPCRSGPSDVKKMIEAKDRIGGINKGLDDKYNKASKYTQIGQKRGVGNPEGRNRRSVWEFASQPYADAHFATFPEQLPRLCILAGTSIRACEACGTQWERIIKKEFIPQSDISKERGVRGAPGSKPMDKSNSWEGSARGHLKTETTGWRSTCSHDNQGAGKPIVLDPFAGKFTVGKVASELGRDFIGIELNPEYVKMGKKEISQIGMAL